MDELEAVRAFRAETPKLDTEIQASARATLEQAIETESAPGPRWKWRFGFARVAVPVTIAVVALVALALASPLFGPRGGQGNAAARQLHSLADVAAQQASGPALTEGMYAYTRSDNVQLNTSASADSNATTSRLVSYTREIWIGADGSGRIHEVGEGLPNGGNEWDQQFGPGELTPPLQTLGLSETELNQLAQNPDELAQVIADRAGGTKNPVNQESFVIVGDLLRESNASAQLRSALFQVAAGIPGVELVGNVSDPAGRKGVSVALINNGIRSELIFDPQSSMLLADRETIVSPVPDLDFPVGTVIGSMTFLQSGIVDSTSAVP